MTMRIDNPMRGGGRGFTSVELMIGITITTMVMGAVTAVSFAVSRAWSHQRDSQSSQITGTLATLRIQDVVRKAKRIGTVREGSLDGDAPAPAAMIFWAGDDNGDGIIQFSEVALLEHADGESGTIRLHRVRFPSGWTQEKIDEENFICTTESLDTASAPEDFKEWLHVEGIDLVRQVTGARFHVQGRESGTQRPMLEFIIATSNGGRTELEYGCAALRGPGEAIP